jgi:glutathione S-transferase
MCNGMFLKKPARSQVELACLMALMPGNRSLSAELRRWFAGLERRLEGGEWIACEMFTVADILLAKALRRVGHTDLLNPYPRLSAYYARALARPAWQRTRSLCAARSGVPLADIP